MSSRVDRMPVPLGDFISEAVYDSKLKSSHAIQDNSCVLFIDVRKGQEERFGSSWKVCLGYMVRLRTY